MRSTHSWSKAGGFFLELRAWCRIRLTYETNYIRRLRGGPRMTPASVISHAPVSCRRAEAVITSLCPSRLLSVFVTGRAGTDICQTWERLVRSFVRWNRSAATNSCLVLHFPAPLQGSFFFPRMIFLRLSFSSWLSLSLRICVLSHFHIFAAVFLYVCLSVCMSEQIFI